MLLTVGNFFSLSSNCRISKNGKKRNKKPTTFSPLSPFFFLHPDDALMSLQSDIKYDFCLIRKRKGGAPWVFMLIIADSDHPMKSDACPQMP